MALVRDYSDSESVNLLSDKAEILFARLLPKLDCNGIYIYDPQLINAYIFPRKNYRVAQIVDWLNELETVHTKVQGRDCPPLMRRYRSDTTGKEYLIIGNFGQKFKFKKGEYPPPGPWPEIEVEEEREVEAESEDTDTRAKNFFRIGLKLYMGPVSDWMKKTQMAFVEQWEMKHGRTLTPAVFERMDGKYFGATFNDEQHVRNAFTFIWDKVENGKAKPGKVTAALSAHEREQARINLKYGKDGTNNTG